MARLAILIRLTLAFIVLASTAAHAATVTANWDPNTDSNLAGYKLSYGTQSGVYTTTIDVGNVTTYQLTLNPGQYFFVVQAYNTSGVSSAYSAEVPYTVPSANAPTITTLTPGSGVVGAAVTITGTNFGATQGTSTVTFNGTTATPTSWSATSIVVPVPPGATTGPVVVTVAGTASNGASFTVTPAAGTIALVQHANADLGGTSAVLAFPAANVAGDLSVVVVRAFVAGQAISVTDSNGNLYRQATQVNNGTDDTLAIYYAQNIAAGANTVTVSVSTSASIRVAILEYGGVALANALDVTASNSATSAGPASGNATTTAAGDLLIGAVSTQSFRTVTSGASYTVREAVAVAPSTVLMVEDAIQPTAGSTSASATLDSSDTWAAAMAAFKPQGAATAPTITSLSPTGGAVGASVTITGTNFGATQGTSVVKFNGTTATPTSWSATSIVAPVPAGATTGNVTVTVGGVASNGSAFTVVPTATITSLSPTSGAVGASVTITGTNFGATQGTSVVKFNGTTATPTSWSATSIVAPVPAGATTGNVTVTVGGVASNGSPFTVMVATVSASPTTTMPGSAVTATWSGVATPSATDWVSLVPVGAPDTAYAAWNYTTGTASGTQSISVPITVTPGTYEPRLFAKDSWQRLAVGAPITIAAATLTANPSSVAAGGALTVAWQSVPQPAPLDWLALVPVGAPDTSYVSWVYATGRSADSVVFPITASTPPGSYEVRFFSNNTFTKRATSAAVTVTTVGPSVVTTPAVAAPGGTSTITWNNVASPTAADWIGLYASGSADAQFVTKVFTNGRSGDSMTTTLPANLAAGTYEFRLFSNNTMTRLAVGNPFSVGAVPTVTASPLATATGGTMTIAWSGVASPTPTDWVALVPINDLDTSYVAWRYTTGTAAGSVTLSLAGVPSGCYEVRLFAHDTMQRMAVSGTVFVKPTLTVSPSTVAPGATVTVTWAGDTTPTAKDWLAVVPLNAPDSSYVAWVYVNGRSADTTLFTLPTTLPAGAYDLRLFANDTFVRLAMSNVVTVTGPGPILGVTPPAMVAGGTLSATWQGIAAPTPGDWIGVYAAGTADSAFLAQSFTTGTSAGTMSVTLPGSLALGDYELRLFSNNSLTRLAVGNGFRVVAGPVLWAASSVQAGSLLNVTWSGIAAPSPTDWVALVPVNATDGTYVVWSFTSGTASGSVALSVPAGTPAGNYEVRLFSNNTLTKLACSNVVSIVP